MQPFEAIVSEHGAMVMRVCRALLGPVEADDAWSETFLAALRAIAAAVEPGGLFAVDICDLEWGELRREAPNFSKVGDGWAMITRFEVPSPDRFVRHITTFVRNDDGSWRRDDERHDNVLVDTAAIPARLAAEGLDVTVGSSFGAETLPPGLRVLVGRR